MGMPLLDVEEGLTKKEAKKRRKEVGMLMYVLSIVFVSCSFSPN